MSTTNQRMKMNYANANDFHITMNDSLQILQMRKKIWLL